MNHLSEREMQAYAAIREKRADYEAHLQTCDECRESLSAYRTVTAFVRQPDSETALPLRFSEAVLDRIEARLEARARFREWLGLIALMLIGVVMTVYYTRQDYSSKPVSDLLQNQVQNTKTYWHVFVQWFGWMGDHFHFLIFGLFLVLLFDLLDKRLRLRPQS